MSRGLHCLIAGSSTDFALSFKTYISKSCYFCLMRLPTEVSVDILEYEFLLNNLLKFAFYLSENTLHLDYEDLPTNYV
jgi:hypothetical protein